MEQIRQFRFEDFRDAKLDQGYKEVLERRWEPNTENEMHHHEFTADALVIHGDLWLTTEGKTQHLYPGDSFNIPAMAKHKEKYGPEGCVFGSREFDLCAVECSTSS